MRSFGSSTLRGGQTVFHGLTMWGQFPRAALFLATACVVTLAEAKLAIGYLPHHRQDVRTRDGSIRVLAIADITALAPASERLCSFALAVAANLCNSQRCVVIQD